MGLLEDNAHWHTCLEETAGTSSPSQLHSLFVILLTMCELADPLNLWNRHRENLSYDILHQYQQTANNTDINYCDEIFNEGLIRLEDVVVMMGGQELSFYGLPNPTRRGYVYIKI